MKYSKRVESLFLQKFYINDTTNQIGVGITYRKGWWLVKNVISPKRVRLFRIPHPSQTVTIEPIVDAGECILNLGDWPLDVSLHAWLRNIVNLRGLIRNWNLAKKKGGLKHSDMFQYTTKEEVWSDISHVLGRETRREHKRLLKASGVKPVHKSKNHFIYKLLTYGGAVVLGKNTKWCISSTFDPSVGRKTFNDYSQRSDMFVIIDRRTNEKWCTLYPKQLRRRFEVLFKYPEVPYKPKKKITGFNQKDVEIEEKQLFLAIKGIAEDGRDEEFLREIFERHASSASCESVHSEQTSAVSMRYDNQAEPGYGMRDHGVAIGAL